MGNTLKSFTFETNLNSYLLKNNFIILIILLSITLGFSSCNTVKYVSENEHLLTKNTIFVNDKKNVDDEINDYIVQRPNQLVLGVPFPLHFYNIGNKNFDTNYEEWKSNHPTTSNFITKVFSEKQTKGLFNFKKGTHNWWLTNGEEPVIFDPKKASQTVENLNSVYHNEGYFNVKTNYDVKFSKNKRATVSYIVNTDKPYVLDTINTNIESKVLDSIYKLKQNESFIKTVNS